MEQLLDSLESNLRKHIEAHRALAALLDEERSALVGLNIQVIHLCINRKAGQAQSIREIERERLSLCQQIAERLGIDERPLRLETVIDHLPEWRRPALQHLRGELLSALQAAQGHSGRNRTLTQNFLNVLNSSMAQVQRSVASLPLYNTSAKVSQANWRGCVLKQTA